MKYEFIKNPKTYNYDKAKGYHLYQFDSINDFYNYLCETPLNDVFRWETLSSSRTDRGPWYGTQSYTEAAELLKNGWPLMAEKLTKKLKITESNKEVAMVAKQYLTVAGYQAIVPLYLNGAPNNMINKKFVPTKQKVITIDKVISVSGSVSSETLQAESIKCFQIIKKIESMGLRVNLNLVLGSDSHIVKIKLKSAGERLNVSKLAFPLVNTSTYRRLFFRFIETAPTIKSSYKHGYGRVNSLDEFKELFKGDIVLPTVLRGCTEDEIRKYSVDELVNML